MSRWACRIKSHVFFSTSLSSPPRMKSLALLFLLSGMRWHSPCPSTSRQVTPCLTLTFASLLSGRSQHGCLTMGCVGVSQDDQMHYPGQLSSAGICWLRLLLWLGRQWDTSGWAWQVYKTLLLQTSFLACAFIVLHASFISAGPAYRCSQNSPAAVNEAFSQRLIQGKKVV